MNLQTSIDAFEGLSAEQVSALFHSASPEQRARLSRVAKASLNQRPLHSYEAHCRRVLAEQELSPAAHHRIIIDAVEDTINGKDGVNRLLITAPPGSAKSMYTSVLLPTYLLNTRPRFNLIGASSTAALAEDFSNRSLAIVEQFPQLIRFQLRQRTAALWTTQQGGRYRAAGVGAKIAGNRADGALIDDPVGSREDADSETIREKTWNWFISDLRTRLKPNAWIICIMTRWHEDDLGGRLIERQKGLWRVLSLPAQAWGADVDTGVIPPDPLGRSPGEWLWNEKYADGDVTYANALQTVKREYEEAGAMRDWSALYDCRPSGGVGTVFKVTKLDTIESDELQPAAGHVWRAWDLAATKQVGTSNPDWTCGVKIQRNKDNTYTVLDVVRVRGGPEDVEALILSTAKADGRAVKIRIPQDPGQAGKSQVKYLVKALAGYSIMAEVVTGDKATRASPAAAQVNIGNVSCLRGSWLSAFRDELASFPSGSHDDQVDAFADAFAMVALKRPLVISAQGLRDLANGRRR